MDRSHQPLTLRPYQKETLTALDLAWTGGRRPTGDAAVNRAAVVLPTGMGKTVIFAELIARTHEAGQRPLILVHREELANQAMAKIHSAVPGASIGLVKAERNETLADITVASIQTLGRPRRREQIRERFGLGIVDECHHAAAQTWSDTMRHFGAWNGTPWAGFTATMSREDNRHLGDIWQEVVIKRSIMDGITGGYLVKPEGIEVQVQDLDLDEVKRSRGEMQAGDLGDAMMHADAGETIAKAYLEHCPGRRAALFAASVPQAIDHARCLNDAGVPTEIVTGQTPSDERALIYERFRTGETLILSSCMVLTEGWDAPWAEVAIIARPTESTALYIQMVGRVLRPWAPGGKTGALVLDVVGASRRHRLVTLAELTTSPEWDAETEHKERPKKQALEPIPYESPWGADGEMVSSEVDLFGSSSSCWLQTPAGLWFISTAESMIFLHPVGNGTFKLGRQSTKRGGKAKLLEPEPLTLEWGQAWAEKYAAEEDPMVSSRAASWRKGRRAATTAQRGKWEQVRGLIGAPASAIEGLSKAEASDLISVTIATRMFDLR